MGESIDQLNPISGDGRLLQSHGLTSKVYVPILRYVFALRYKTGDTVVEFTLDDIRDAAAALGIVVRNAADVIYRMRSRTVLPAEILELGFYVLTQAGRGRYRFEQASSTVIDLPNTRPIEALDLTPNPVRRLLPEHLADMDEQAILMVAGYCNLWQHFTGLTVYRLRSHVRKSVPGVGQAELDEVNVAVAVRDDEVPVIIPVEAKAVADPVNRVQIATQVAFANRYFAEHEFRPMTIKVDRDSVLNLLEFNATPIASEIEVIRSARYRLILSDRQRHLIDETDQVML
uniref:AsiSI endonuclease n=1 Tax=Arthrobacter sp. S TaxID=228746 RepID=Q83XX1_9MICC|nr:AsiSI endonuclease [Arthrobacter sp. S]